MNKMRNLTKGNHKKELNKFQSRRNENCNREHQQQNGSVEERICDLEDRAFEIIQSEENKRVRTAYVIYEIPPKEKNLQIIGDPGEERKKEQKVYLNSD